MNSAEPHVPYQDRLHHQHDFVVRYCYFLPEHGGRAMLPVQGIRSDFRYANEEPHSTSVWMIWPEFEDENGEVILDRTLPVPASGTARMWIVNPDRRSIHQHRIDIGTKGYFIEGTPVAECEVIEIVGLRNNPTTGLR